MTDTNLTAQEVEALREALLEERRRLLRNVGQLASETRQLGADQGDESGPGGSQADVATDLMSEELELALSDLESEHLKEVDAALHRIEEGTYGLCDSCGKPIGLERLRARPWAALCIECAGRLARRG